MTQPHRDLTALSALEKRALLRQLLEEKAGEPEGSTALSYGQRALWYLWRLAPESAAYNVVHAARIRGELDESALHRALQALVDRHPALRTLYVSEAGKPLQRVLKRHAVCFERVPAASWSAERLEARLREEADRPFDLERGPLLRVHLFARSAQDAVLLLVVHHIAVDLWSLEVLLSDVRELYRAERAAEAPALPRLHSRYTDYVAWHAELLAGAEGERHLAYWSQRLSGELPALALPTDRPRKARKTYCGAAHEFRLEAQVLERLMELARASRATPYMVCLATFAVLLHRYSGQDDVLIGSPTAGRSLPLHERLVGYFSNPVVLRADLSGNPRFGEFLQRIRRVVLEALEHQDYPFALLVEQLRPPRDPQRSPVFDVSFAWDKLRRPEGLAPAGAQRGASDLALEPLFSQQRGAPFDLTLGMVEGSSAIAATLQYNTDLFDASTIERMAGHFVALLDRLSRDPEQRIGDVPLLGAAERARILVEWNRSDAHPAAGTLVQAFEAQVERTPDATAVLAGSEALSFDALNRRANRLAHRLRALGVAPEVRVGVLLQRSPDLVVALLAVLKAGGAYVPLDATQPRERLEAILKDARVAVLLGQTALAQGLVAAAPQLLCLDAPERAPAWPDANPTGAALPDHLAYVLYTSGSTGTPKGVMVPHRGLANYLAWSTQAYGAGCGRGAPLHTSIGFDLTITSLFPPLLAGAPVILLQEGAEQEELARALCSQSDFSLVKLTPSHLELLAQRSTPERVAGGARAFVIGGEALSIRELAFWRQHAPDTRLINEYGPTETVVGCCVYEVPAESSGSASVPIGRPIANTQMYVLDERLEPVPVGITGELYIGGAGVARGYFGAPGLTAERFVPNPFGFPGSRLYRTGDLGRYLPTGELEFLGRVDRQIKVRGFRIEPAEIEVALGAHPAVRACAVLARRDSSGRARLVAWWAANSDAQASTSELRQFLKERLPEYMLPAAFVRVPALPLTVNGKLDQRALPEPEASRPELEHAFVAPRTPVEQTLTSLFERVLEIAGLGIHDNFFDLGGTSLHSVEIAAEAQAAGIEFAPELLLEHQTIAELAAAARLAPGAQAGAHTVIESLGVYLPQRKLSTEEVVRGCRRPVRLPLQRVTGIVNRRRAGDTEFSIDLAHKAVADCLANSRHDAQDIDLLVCCNISRCDGPLRFSFEPCTAARIRKAFGFDRAIAFDVSNACAGMFTGIYLVDALIRAGALRRGMVVSGEYISHLTDTAQREIEGALDPRLACLTLGDAGAAVILEESASGAGLQAIEMFTLGRYSTYCIAKLTDGEVPGAIMLTDAIASTNLAVEHTVKHALQLLDRHGWSPEDVHQVVMHQTSSLAIQSATQKVNRLLAAPVCHPGNVINNLAERGNTATTTHIVAVRDAILDGKLESGDRVVFGITGSGQTIGTALYRFDDLPERIRARELSGKAPRKRPASVRPVVPLRTPSRGVRVESAATAPAEAAASGDAIELAKAAARACLARSRYAPSDIDLVLYTGVYRNDFLSEPAIASMVAGALEMNADVDYSQQASRRTLAFDVFNGAQGFLKACWLATQLIQSGRAATAMIVASEIENNARVFPSRLLGIEETGSAMILDASHAASGFGRFHFRHASQHIDAWVSHTAVEEGKAYLHVSADPERERYLLELIARVVAEALGQEGVGLAELRAVLPPELSAGFAERLAEALGIETERIMQVDSGKAHWSSSLACGWFEAQKHVKQGDLGLWIAGGSGMEAGCVLYRF